MFGLAQTDGCLFVWKGRKMWFSRPLTDHGSYAFRKKEKVKNYSVSTFRRRANYQIIRIFTEERLLGVYLDLLSHVVIACFHESVTQTVSDHPSLVLSREV